MKAVKDEFLTEVSHDSDIDLLEIISWKDDLELRNKAFTEFHKRYTHFLYSVVNLICNKFPNGHEMSTAITNNVLINVYKYSSSFKYEGEQTDSHVRKKIEAWLVGIAKQEMRSLLSDSKDIQEEQIAYNKMLASSANEKNIVSYNEDIVQKAFSQLKPRDQDILRTYWIFYEKGSGSQAKNMPLEILQELAHRYETTSENIRQIISRSNKTVKEFLQKNYKVSK